MGRVTRDLSSIVAILLAALALALGLAWSLRSFGIELSTLLLFGFAATALLIGWIIIRSRVDHPVGPPSAHAQARLLAPANLPGLAFSDRSGTIVDASDAFVRMTGYSQDVLAAGRVTWNTLLESHQSPFDPDAVFHNSAGVGFEPVERALICADGSKIPVIISPALLDASQKQIGCFVIDISRIKEAETVVRSHRDLLEKLVQQRTAELSTAHGEVTTSRDLLRAVIEGIGDPVFLKDTEGRYQMINEAGARVLGRSIDQVIGQNDLAVFGDAAGQVVMDMDRRIMESGREESFDQELPTSIGNRIFLTTKVAHRDRQGRIIGLIGIARDITERKAMERGARDANAAKDRFLAILSHELRTPLMPVLATASTLEADPSTPDQIREDARLIRRNIEMEARLIDDLLDVTRIAKGKLELKPESVDLHRVVEDVVQVCRPEVDARNLRLVSSLHAERRFVRGDPARLRQILWNLIRNAAKFTPAGGEISVECVNADDPTRIKLVVTDTGIGIGPQTMQRIFNAFEQGDTGITRRFGGLGLGLMLSRAFAEAHGGALTAYSAGPGQGATFTVDLPTCPDPAALDLPESSRDASLLDLNVLVVDDHADTTRTLARVLQVLGCRPVIAGSIAQGKKLLRDQCVDLVICDIHLPDGTGHELARLLGPRRIPAIALSGSGMPQDVRLSIEAGFLEHLVKPVRFEQIEAVLRRIASARPQSHEEPLKV